jgi:hypothetical protein
MLLVVMLKRDGKMARCSRGIAPLPAKIARLCGIKSTPRTQQQP